MTLRLKEKTRGHRRCLPGKAEPDKMCKLRSKKERGERMKPHEGDSHLKIDYGRGDQPRSTAGGRKEERRIPARKNRHGW